MKKQLRLLPLILIPLVLSGCKQTKESSSDVITSSVDSQSSVVSSEVSSEPSIAPSSTISSSSMSNSSSSAISSSAPAPYEVKVGEKYKTSYWDESIQQMIQTTVGDVWDKVPTFTAPNYEAVMDYAMDGPDKFLVFEIKCFNPNANSAVRLYREKLEALGYTIASTNDYGYCMKDNYNDLFVGYEVVDADIPYFYISVVVRHTREETWNSAAIKAYAEIDVPSFPATAYQTTYDNSKDSMTIFALFVDKNAISQYETILQNAHYTFNTQSTLEMPMYVDPTGYVTVQLYQTYGDYNCDALYISINNAWPTTSIRAFQKDNTLPRLESSTASFDTYVYMDLGGQGRDEDYVLCIYYVNASTVDFSNYVQLLLANDYESGDPYTSTSGVVSVTLTTYIDLYTAEVTVAFNPSSSELCIAVYQAYLDY